MSPAAVPTSNPLRLAFASGSLKGRVLLLMICSTKVEALELEGDLRLSQYQHTPWRLESRDRHPSARSKGKGKARKKKSRQLPNRFCTAFFNMSGCPWE